MRTYVTGLIIALIAGGCSASESENHAAVDVATAADTAPAADGASLEVEQPADASETDSAEDTGTAEKLSIIDNTIWTVVGAELDPFYEAAGGKADLCPPEALKVEEVDDGLWFDVRTKTCGYITVTQPSQAAVTKGSELFVRVWHFKATEGDGPFHLALAFGDPTGSPDAVDVVWEETIGIPSDSNLLFLGFEAKADYPAGTPLYWHVSNHGDNSWNLIEFSVTP